MTTTEHFIAGKDASLEQSIGTMQSKLASLGFNIEEHSWLNPVENIWSVHVRDQDCPLLYASGKGASQLAARASALGEFFERLSCNCFWSRCYLGEANANAAFSHYPQEKWFALDGQYEWPEGLLTERLQTFYNPQEDIDAEALVDLNTGNIDRGICAIPYVRQRDGETVYFPVNIIENLYASNGMSAGNSPEEARAHALSEILERHVKFRVIHEGLCLPDVPRDVIARYPAAAASIRGLREAGFGVLVKDASLGGIYPVISVALLNPRDHGCFASFGAHPKFEVALERALAELLQGRALESLDGFSAPALNLEEVATTFNIGIDFVDSSGAVPWRFLHDTPDFAFSDWNQDGSTKSDFAWLCDRVHSEVHDVYISDFTHLGVYACRILVPGMSEIYPVDVLEYGNNSVGNDLRPSILQLSTLSDEECSDLLEALNDLDLDPKRLVAAVIGLAADPGSIWEDLRVGELKALLGLAAGEEDAIHQGLEWIRHCADLNETRRHVYHCIETLLSLESDEPYQIALEGLYGKETLQRAYALLSGEERFFGIKSPGAELNNCATHRKLLDAYLKVQQAKARPAS